MRVDTRPKYKVKEKIVAKGVENYTIPYKGKILEKTFDKGVILIGNESNINGQKIVIVQETIAENTFDKDTKQPFTGMVYFTLDPSKLEIFDAKEEAKKQIQDALKQQANPTNVPTKTGVSIYRKLAGAYNKNLIVAVVLVAGYFAYKKFKK
jgi:hypothetical protein